MLPHQTCPSSGSRRWGISNLIACAYLIFLIFLTLYTTHAYIMIFLNVRRKRRTPPKSGFDLPSVTVQLPIYNERYVVQRLIRRVCQLNYPRDLLEIQILDDSTDETGSIVDQLVAEYRKRGYDIKVIRRTTRHGFKAGALQNGLRRARGEFLAIFDADFLPPRDFLIRLIGEFQNPKVGAVQARWGHINDRVSWFTLAQAIALDGHFILEQRTRAENDLFITFNGTGGIWRKEAIEDSGGWHTDTLTEDLDLSMRAQLRGWKIVYRDDVVVPGEIPFTVESFRTQQSRWARGTIQTGIKLLPKILRSHLSLFKKFEAFIQLSAHFVYPALLGIAVFSFPIIYFKINNILPRSYFLILSLLSIGAFAYPLYYAISQREIYPDWRRRIRFIPHIIANCMGMSLNITVSVIEGLLRKGGEFHRTPKFGDARPKINSIPSKFNPLPFLELLFGVYLLYSGMFALVKLQLFILPFLFTYSFGFFYFGLQSLRVKS
ncbi:glycosyl transferase family 2 [candidate division WOR-3 bacterium]|uniref:Glycosyl transferase family 2 n=1 Tax=candidate division WOR-3 bacterium TaxID=2052148 RepID=A0A660SKK3_UNCW3|nr:MAG: glycosyl transferase family 2 [candidate division WOR-3 bacterium]